MNLKTAILAGALAALWTQFAHAEDLPAFMCSGSADFCAKAKAEADAKQARADAIAKGAPMTKGELLDAAEEDIYFRCMRAFGFMEHEEMVKDDQGYWVPKNPKTENEKAIEWQAMSRTRPICQGMATIKQLDKSPEEYLAEAAAKQRQAEDEKNAAKK